MAGKLETTPQCGGTEREVRTMTKQKRMLAMAMAAAILFIVLASAFFIAAEANHDCVGDGCEICCQINVCRTVLKGLALAIIAAVLAAAASRALHFLFVGCRLSAPRCTRVSLKVKLSD